MPRHKSVPPSACSLDYEKCTLQELRTFICDRTTTPLSERDLQRIQNCNRDQLTNRLHKLDQICTFPRFMELPPELRVKVYEPLLIDTRVKDEDGRIDWTDIPAGMRKWGTLHPAMLRASKQIYLEAQPILYKQNEFYAKIMYYEDGRGRSPADIGCELSISQPGNIFDFNQVMRGCPHRPFLHGLFQDPAMGMLRMLQNLTVDLSLVTPGEDESYVYVAKACDAIASLCLSLTGASKMEELTIKVEPNYPQRDNIDLHRILWPLMFLRTSIVVIFEGIPAIPETTLTHPGMMPQAEAYYGRMIALVRERCNKQIDKHG